VCDKKVEGRENLKESRKILAYPTSVLLVLSAFICVHRRPISGFGFRAGPEEKHIWPPMNADERG
jgi:hypothetical protein